MNKNNENNIKKIGLVWPPEAVITESLFRHFNCLAEVCGYLKEKSRIINELNINVAIYDCAVETYTAFKLSKIVKDCDVIALCLNMNNILEAIETAKFFKSIDREIKIIAYGEGICCKPDYFKTIKEFDYIIGNGQYELGIEIAIKDILKMDNAYLNSVLDDKFIIQDRVIMIDNDVFLPAKEWGIPDVDELPLEAYKHVGGEELHITACKGCPYNCEFCNEKYVSTHHLRYRSAQEVVDYLIKYRNQFKTAYLDASTFTFNREWVIELCELMIKNIDMIIPWKTCTRLDCIDDELISYMGKANCKRISIGIESINTDIQKRNGKIIDYDKLKHFAEICRANGITPRGLLIIGLEGQNAEEIYAMEDIFKELKIETRVRVLQDFSFFVTGEEITDEKIKSLNRWLVQNPIAGIDINTIRRLEFPDDRTGNFA